MKHPKTQRFATGQRSERVFDEQKLSDKTRKNCCHQKNETNNKNHHLWEDKQNIVRRSKLIKCLYI